MKTGNVYLNIAIREYEERLSEYRKELKKMPRGYLSRRRGKTRSVFVQVLKDKAGGRRRRSIGEEGPLVNALARKRYLQTAIGILENDIGQLERLAKGYKEPTAANVLELMPPVYRELPVESFFPKQRTTNKWAEMEYRHNTFNEAEKVHITSGGLRVRSKSELIIAEKLDKYEIPYRYEEMVDVGPYSFSPDFTINTGKVMIYWEHCGLMSSPGYRKRSKWKLDMYEQAGIVPWKNLIVTYDTEDGGVNSGVIESVIKNQILPMMAEK